MTDTYQFTKPSFQKSIPDTITVDTTSRRYISRSSGYFSFDSTAVDTTVVVIKPKSTLAATLLSVVIPGGGQIYNGSYWKIPIIYGLQGFFIYEWIQNNNSYKSFRAQLEDSLKVAGPPPWSSQEQYYISSLQGYRDAYRDQRDSYAWYMAGVAVLSILDAYIDAELSGFDISPSLGFAPDRSATVAISLVVKL